MNRIASPLDMPVKTESSMVTDRELNAPTRDKPANVDEENWIDSAALMVTALALLQLLYDTTERKVVSGSVLEHKVAEVTLVIIATASRAVHICRVAVLGAPRGCGEVITFPMQKTSKLSH